MICGCGLVVVYDLFDGSELWWVKGMIISICGMVVLWGEFVFVSGGYLGW